MSNLEESLQDIASSLQQNADGQRDRSELKDALIVEKLAAGASYRSAAEAAGASERTVRRRMADSEFRGRVAEARRELLTRLTGQAMASGEEALEVVKRVMREGSPAESLRAASLMLSAMARLHDAADVREQMDALQVELQELRVRGGSFDE